MGRFFRIGPSGSSSVAGEVAATIIVYEVTMSACIAQSRRLGQTSVATPMPRSSADAS